MLHKYIKGLSFGILLATSIHTSAMAEEVLATFGDDKKITMKEAEEFLKAVNGGRQGQSVKDLPAEVKANIAKNIAIGEIIKIELEKQKYVETPAFKKDVEQAREMLLQRHFVKAQVEKMDKPDLQELYKEEIKAFEGKFESHVKHIVTNSEEEIKKVYSELSKNKKKFDELAKEYSMDPGTKDKGGDLGWIRTDQMLKEFHEAVQGLDKGQMSRPFKTDFGWHVAMVLAKRKVAVPTLESLKANLQAKQEEMATKKYLDSLIGQYNLKILANESKN